MNARRSPKWVPDAHPTDQRPQIRIDLRFTPYGTGFPSPVQARAGTMPPHDGLGPNDGDRLQDRRKPSIQPDEEPPIAVCEFETTSHLPPQYGRSSAFSATSLLVDLNGEVTSTSKKHNSATIVVDDRQFGYRINPDQVFGMHGIAQPLCQSPYSTPDAELLWYQRAAPPWNGRMRLRVKFEGTVSAAAWWICIISSLFAKTASAMA